MTDRPDPFDDLEFETAEPIEPQDVAARVTVPAPQPQAEAKPEPAAAADPKPAEDAPKAEPGAPAHSSNIVGYATLALSGLAFAGTIAAVVTTLASRPHEPKVSPEHAAIGRIEALLTGQQGKLDHMAALAAQPAAPSAPPAGAAELTALAAAVHANQASLDKIPSLLAQQFARMPRGAAAPAAARPVVITRTIAAPAPAGSPAIAEVMKTQAAIQRQLDALAAKMARTTAACVTQSDGTIRYP